MDKTYEVTMTVKVRVTMDETLLPDAEYRRDFADLHTQAELAEQIAYTAARGWERVEGLTDAQHKLIKWINKDIEIEETREVAN